MGFHGARVAFLCKDFIRYFMTLKKENELFLSNEVPKKIKYTLFSNICRCVISACPRTVSLCVRHVLESCLQCACLCICTRHVNSELISDIWIRCGRKFVKLVSLYNAVCLVYSWKMLHGLINILHTQNELFYQLVN